MFKLRSCLAAVPIGAALFGTALPANATVDPPVGNDTLGPALILTINPGGGYTVTNGPDAGIPYDGVEDTYIGVVNSSGGTVSSVTLTAPSSIGVFGFDGDGIGAGPPYQGPGSGSVQYGTPNSSDSSGYGGPIGYFSNIVLGSGAGNDTGVLHFAGGLSNGGTTWFSLEEPLAACAGSLCSATTPLPAALPLLGTGLGRLGLLGWRRKREAAVPNAVA